MRFTIRDKLIVKILLTLCALIFITVFGISKMNIINLQSTIIATELVPLIEMASDLKGDFNEYRNMQYRHILSTTPEEMTAVEGELTATQDAISKLIEDYSTKIKTEEEKSMLKDLTDHWSSYLALNDSLLAISRNNDFEGAFNKIKEMKSAYDNTILVAEKMILFNHELAQGSSEKADSVLADSVVLLIVVVIVSFLILGTFQFFIIFSVTRPIAKMKVGLGELARSGGDLTQRIDVNSKDEIGDLAIEVNNFLANLRDIISGVLVSSKEIGHMAEELTGTVTNLNYEIEEISSTTEELSAGLEESNATTEEINSVSQEVEQVTADIARKAEDGASNSYEISKRAESVKTMAVLASKNANEVYEKSNQRLLKAMKDAKAVENINVLAESILGITNQTNLLALNAAIEAARAGQAGRGFAVVADEIRKLAEESKESANQIQEVTGVIVEAVRFLSESASEILNFIDGQVKKDYDKLVEVAEQYKDDADFVTNMSTDLSASAEELSASLQNIVHSISEISKATEESAAGATNIANRTTNILGSAQNVSELTEGTRVNVKELIELISKFKV